MPNLMKAVGPFCWILLNALELSPVLHRVPIVTGVYTIVCIQRTPVLDVVRNVVLNFYVKAMYGNYIASINLSNINVPGHHTAFD